MLMEENIINEENREVISHQNVGVLYFDLKTASEVIGVSINTLYAHNKKGSLPMYKAPFDSNKNYIYLDDMNKLKEEMDFKKSARNNSSITVGKNNNSQEAEEISKLNQKIEYLTQKCDDLEKQRDSNISIVNKLLEDNKALQKEIQDLEHISGSDEEKSKRLIELSTENKNLRTELNDIKTEKESLLNQLSEAKIKIESLGKLEEKVKQLEKELKESKDTQLDTLIKHNKDILAANGDLSEKFDKLIESQKAFQVMLYDKDQKLIEEKEEKEESKGLFSFLKSKKK